MSCGRELAKNQCRNSYEEENGSDNSIAGTTVNTERPQRKKTTEDHL